MDNIVWVKMTQLDRTVIVDDVVYAPTDAADAKNLPKKVKISLGLIVEATDQDEPEEDESAPTGG